MAQPKAAKLTDLLDSRFMAKLDALDIKPFRFKTPHGRNRDIIQTSIVV